MVTVIQLNDGENKFMAITFNILEDYSYMPFF